MVLAVSAVLHSDRCLGAKSLSALAMGARQLVVQEAAEITVSSAFKVSWFTLYTIVGRAKAIGLVIPELNGKLIGSAQRVPTPTGSCHGLHYIRW